MKIDMSPPAITRRLKQASELRRLCLALAQTSIGRKIREEHKANKVVQRTSRALGPEDE